MINYLLKSGMLLLVFYAVYKLLLQNEKMFRFNRVYLLGSLIFSFIIPLQLFSVQPLFSDVVSTIQLDGIVIQASKRVSASINYSQLFGLALWFVYSMVIFILGVRFFKNLYALYKTSLNNEYHIIENQKIVLLQETILPHSFWNTIFINKLDFENGKISTELIAHEKAHLIQKHSLDILFVAVLKIVFWFNPLLFLFEKAIKLNHEFLADEAVNRQFEEISNYQKMLLDIALDKTTVALASTINYLITKKRFVMMTKKESPITVSLKVFGVGIVFVVSLFIFSSEAVAQEVNVNSDNKTGNVYRIESVDKLPEFPGGIEEFYKFVGMNFKIPAEVGKNKIEGKTYMKFVIEKDGSLSNIMVLTDVGYGIGDEATRVLKLSPKWIAATKDGKAVRVLYSLPIKVEPEK